MADLGSSVEGTAPKAPIFSVTFVHTHDAHHMCTETDITLCTRALLESASRCSAATRCRAASTTAALAAVALAAVWAAAASRRSACSHSHFGHETLAAISRTFLVACAAACGGAAPNTALRQILLVLVDRRKLRGSRRRRAEARNASAFPCGDQIVALFRNTRIFSTVEFRKSDPRDRSQIPSRSRRYARICLESSSAKLDRSQSLGR